MNDVKEKMDRIIREVAVKNGIAIGHNDPILVVHTMIEELLLDASRQQKEQLDEFHATLETLTDSFCENIGEQAKSLINTSLERNKELALFEIRTYSDLVSNEIMQQVNRMADTITQATQETRQITRILTGFCFLNVVIAVFVLWMSFR